MPCKMSYVLRLNEYQGRWKRVHTNFLEITIVTSFHQKIWFLEIGQKLAELEKKYKFLFQTFLHSLILLTYLYPIALA